MLINGRAQRIVLNGLMNMIRMIGVRLLNTILRNSTRQ